MANSNSKVDKILNISKSMKGKTLTNKPANQIEIYGINVGDKKHTRPIKPELDHSKNFII